MARRFIHHINAFRTCSAWFGLFRTDPEWFGLSGMFGLIRQGSECPNSVLSASAEFKGEDRWKILMGVVFLDDPDQSLLNAMVHGCRELGEREVTQ